MEPDENPLDGNTEEVLAYAADHPDEVDALIKAEEDAAARKGVLEGLTSLSEANAEEAEKAEAKAAKKAEKAEAKKAEAAAEEVFVGDNTDLVQNAMVVAQTEGEAARQATIASHKARRDIAQKAMKATGQN